MNKFVYIYLYIKLKIIHFSYLHKQQNYNDEKRKLKKFQVNNFDKIYANPAFSYFKDNKCLN